MEWISVVLAEIVSMVDVQQAVALADILDKEQWADHQEFSLALPIIEHMDQEHHKCDITLQFI